MESRRKQKLHDDKDQRTKKVKNNNCAHKMDVRKEMLTRMRSNQNRSESICDMEKVNNTVK